MLPSLPYSKEKEADSRTLIASGGMKLALSLWLGVFDIKTSKSEQASSGLEDELICRDADILYQSYIKFSTASY